MKKHISLLVGLGAVFALASCGKPSEATTTAASLTTNTTTVAPTTTESPTTTAAMEAFKVLNADGKEEGYTIDDAAKTYTFTVAGEYTLSGTYEGSLVFADTLTEKVTLNLEGVDITSTKSVIQWLSEESKIEIKAKRGFTNNLITVKDGASAYNTIDSANNIEFGGKGYLYIENNQKHAVSGSDISITSDVQISIDSSVKDGIHCKSFTMEKGTLVITAADDGIQAEQNKKKAKGTIEVLSGTIGIYDAKVGLKADTSIVFNKEGDIYYDPNNVTTNYEAPLIDIGTGRYPAAE